jgi:excisionase family DNA binding protein
MEKICIVKLRKQMTSPATPEERYRRGGDVWEDSVSTGPYLSVAGNPYWPDTREEEERSDGRTKAAERVVSLKLTREQMKELQSNPALASFLRDKMTAECNTVHHEGESIVIKFEFDAVPHLSLLKVEEVVHMLRISKSYLNRAIKGGDLKSYKFGRRRRFMFEDILSYLESHQEMSDAGELASESRIYSKEVV